MLVDWYFLINHKGRKKIPESKNTSQHTVEMNQTSCVQPREKWNNKRNEEKSPWNKNVENWNLIMQHIPNRNYPSHKNYNEWYALVNFLTINNCYDFFLLSLPLYWYFSCNYEGEDFIFTWFLLHGTPSGFSTTSFSLFRSLAPGYFGSSFKMRRSIK